MLDADGGSKTRSLDMFLGRFAAISINPTELPTEISFGKNSIVMATVLTSYQGTVF